MTFRISISLLLWFSLLFPSLVFSQEADSTISQIKVKNADNFIAERKDDADHQIFRGNVKMFHDSIYMYADSTYIVGDEMTSVGEVIIIQEDTINVFCDSIYYNAASKKSKLFYNVVLESGERQLFTQRLDYDLGLKKATFQDTAIMRKGEMQLSSIKGVYDLESKKARFTEEVVIIDGEFRLTSDSLDYDTELDRAYFNGPTYITEGPRNIYCEDGYYDIELSKAFLTDNTYIKEADKTILADNIEYVGADSLIILEGKVSIEDSTSMTKGDKIMIYQDKDEVEIIGNAFYQEDDNIITGPYIRYNEKTEDVYCEGRTTISASDGILNADSINYVKASDSGIAVGNVIWTDTLEDRSIRSDKLFYKKESGYYRAEKQTLRPVFLQLIDGDTLYVSADTLVRIQSDQDSLNHIKAVDDVQIFKSDLQARADSMYYAEVDSIFKLFKRPLCWSDSTAISGDTILLYLKNEEVSEIETLSKAWIITEHSSGYYDQIKGRHIHSFLDSSQLQKMIVKGNAESIYMIKDDEEAYVGPNKTVCSHMTFYFENEELDHIKFYTQPDSKMTPMAKASTAELKLEGFIWDESQRPQDCVSIRLPGMTRPQTSEKPPEQMDEFESAVQEAVSPYEEKYNSNREEKKGLGKKKSKAE